MSNRGMPPGRRALAVVAVVLGALAVVLRARRGGRGASPAAEVDAWSAPEPLRTPAPTPPPRHHAEQRHEPDAAVTAVTAPAPPPPVRTPPADLAPSSPPAPVAASPPALPPHLPVTAHPAEDAAAARTARRGATGLILVGAAVLAATAVAAFAATRAAGDAAEPTSGVAGTQATKTSPSAAPAPTTPTTTAADATPAAADPPRATAATTVRARGVAILQADDAALGDFVGARVVARRARVGDVVGNRIFWIGTGDERLLVHLQGPGTRWAVRKGQLVSFTAILTPTKPGSAEAWGLDPNQGRAEQQRQGHHLEVFGPHMRFDCVRRCG